MNQKHFLNDGERQRWIDMYSRALNNGERPRAASEYADADMEIMRSVLPVPVHFDLPALLAVAEDVLVDLLDLVHDYDDADVESRVADLRQTLARVREQAGTVDE
jgi:hypothetical protein